MSRTTPTLVRQICSGIDDSLTDDQITPYITVANSMVTNILGSYYPDDTTPTLIETWLTAWAFTLDHPQTNLEKAGDVQESYQFTVGMNLNANKFGDMVLILDVSGLFASAQQTALNGKRPAINVTYIGGCAPRSTMLGYRSCQ